MSQVRSTSHRTGNARRTLSHKLRAQTRAADPTIHDEDEYDRDVPTMSISKVFVVILLLHVVVLFGLIVMQWSKKAGDPGHGSASTTPALIPAPAETPTAPARPGHPEPHHAVGSGDPVVVAPLPEDAPLAPPGSGRRGEIPAGWETYTVAGGESIDDIARHTRVEKRWLEKANEELGRMEIRTGAVLAVPSGAVVEEWEIDARIASTRPVSRLPAEPAAPTGRSEPRPAANADTGRESGNEASRVAAVEPVEVDGPAREPAVQPAAAASSGGATHTVAKGETFYRIARDHGVTVEALMQANGYSDASGLQIGATLRIP